MGHIVRLWVRPMPCQHCSPVVCANALAGAAKPTIDVVFVKPDGSRVPVKAPIGDSMLEVAHANNIDVEGG